jgi:hypothetical protein
VLKPSDPQDLDPYDYAEDNPVTGSDPSGLMTTGGGPPNPCGAHGDCGYPTAPTDPNPPPVAGGGGYTGSSPAPGAEFTQQLVLDHLLLLYQQWLAQQRAIQVAEHRLRQDAASCLRGSVSAHLTGCGTLGDAAALTSAEAGQCIGSAAAAGCRSWSRPGC